MRGVRGAASMPVANLRQILFVFSAGSHEELMKLSVMLLSLGRGGRIRAWQKRKVEEEEEEASQPSRVHCSCYL